MEWQSMNNIYFFIRHGQSLANLKHLVITKPENAITHYGLSAVGKKQVKDSIKANKELDKDTIIYSSDFKRARETAEIVSKYLKSGKPIFSKNLRERNLGIFEKGKDNMYHELWENDLKGKTLKSCESVSSIAKRIKELIANIEKTHKNKNILLVTHGDIISVGLSVLNKKPVKQHHKIFSISKNAEISKVNPTLLKSL